MKKLLFIPIALLFFACPSDDDMPPAQDQIIGTWKFFKEFEDGVEVQLDVCETLQTLSFLADGAFTGLDYDEDIMGECVLDETSNGTWENAGNGAYSITTQFGTDTQQLTFEGNTFYVEEIDDFGTPGDTSDDVLYRYVYQKQ